MLSARFVKASRSENGRVGTSRVKASSERTVGVKSGKVSGSRVDYVNVPWYRPVE